MMRYIAKISVLLILLVAAGCSTTPTSTESGDDAVEQQPQVVEEEADSSDTPGGMGLKGSGGGGAGYGRISGLEESPEPATSQPTARIGDIRSERDDLEGFLALLEGRANAFTYCYERELQQTPGLDGTIHLSWSIDAAGELESAEVQESTVGSEAVESCFVRVAGGTNFDGAEVGQGFEVTTVFELSR